MEIGETIYVTTSDEFRKWLLQNHQTKKEIWLIQYKKAAKKPSIHYVEAVEEALCFGWIDGLEKSMDAERYALRFSPRRPRSTPKSSKCVVSPGRASLSRIDRSAPCVGQKPQHGAHSITAQERRSDPASSCRSLKHRQ